MCARAILLSAQIAFADIRLVREIAQKKCKKLDEVWRRSQRARAAARVVVSPRPAQ